MNRHALVLALSIALCTHIVLYALLNLWPAPTPDIVKKSIPVRLVVSPDRKPSTASHASNAQQARATEETISSTGENTFKVKSAEQSINSPSLNSNTRQANSSQSAASQNRSERSRAQASSIRQIFSSTAEEKQPIQAVQKEATQAMSDYEIQLLKHLLAGELYDQFHRYMRSQKETQVDFRVRIRLFENGAIKSASILDKSKDLDIDRLAVNAAYNASPYPRPPEEDFEVNYTYDISMSYNESGLH